jgi:hypothetical protein
MIVESEKTKPRFEPVAITITFENEEEIVKFYAIFNTPIILDCIRYGEQGSAIRDGISKEYPKAYSMSDGYFMALRDARYKKGEK